MPRTPEANAYRALLNTFSSDHAATKTPAESAAVFQRLGDAKRAKLAAEQTQATIGTADTLSESRLLTGRLS